MDVYIYGYACGVKGRARKLLPAMPKLLFFDGRSRVSQWFLSLADIQSLALKLVPLCVKLG